MSVYNGSNEIFDGVEQHWPRIGQARLRFYHGAEVKALTLTL